MTMMSKFQSEPVSFVESINVTEGVVCDVYTFDNDSSKDLALVTVQPGCKTPFQKVLGGDETLEIYKAGTGSFYHTDISGNQMEYAYPGGPAVISVQLGELMQWKATGTDELVFLEICTPPYKDGRYENLPE